MLAAAMALATIIDPSHADDAADLSGYDLTFTAPKPAAHEPVVWLEDADIEAIAGPPFNFNKLSFPLSDDKSAKLKLHARGNTISAAIAIALD